MLQGLQGDARALVNETLDDLMAVMFGEPSAPPPEGVISATEAKGKPLTVVATRPLRVRAYGEKAGGKDSPE